MPLIDVADPGEAPFDIGAAVDPTAAALEDFAKNFSILAIMCLP